MITLPHHCEFLSDVWLEQATKFLQRDLVQRKDKLSGRAFSISERFTNSPPHLKFADDVAAWSMRFDGSDLTVSREFDSQADLVVEGDYQAALTAAQFVGLLAPGAMKAMNREVATLYGRETIRVRGGLEGGQHEMLALLHDHMGRRTVENPDLAHRAARQSLSAKIRHLEEHGYAVIENAISPEFADEVRAAVLRALLPHQTFSMNWMLYHGREFERLIQNPALMTLIDASLGRGAVIASFSSIKKGPGSWRDPDAYRLFARTGTVSGIRNDRRRCVGAGRLDRRFWADLDRSR